MELRSTVILKALKIQAKHTQQQITNTQPTTQNHSETQQTHQITDTQINTQILAVCFMYWCL